MHGLAESLRGGASAARGGLLAGIGILVAAAWATLIWMHSGSPDMGMQQMSGMAMAGPDLRPWHATDLALVFWMWAVMMAAMMVPTAVPAILVFDRVADARRRAGRPVASTAVFVAGYVLAWTSFSLGASLAQWALHAAAGLSAGMATTHALAGAAILVAAGIYQWSPLKGRCLAHCRSPLEFLAEHFRDGRLGALRTGFHHGVYCIGCCWLLMAVLFVAGVMNLAWIALLAAAVLAEKTLPHGPLIARATGVVLIGWGAWLAL